MLIIGQQNYKKSYKKPNPERCKCVLCQSKSKISAVLVSYAVKVFTLDAKFILLFSKSVHCRFSTCFYFWIRQDAARNNQLKNFVFRLFLLSSFTTFE